MAEWKTVRSLEGGDTVARQVSLSEAESPRLINVTSGAFRDLVTAALLTGARVGELKAAKRTEIVCEVEGRSTIISLIPEGTAVKEGDLLVELASDAIADRIQQDELKETNAITAYEASETELEILLDKNESDIRKARLDIELRQLALDKYEKGDWLETIQDAVISIKQAQINLERRKEDFEAAKAAIAPVYDVAQIFDDPQYRARRDVVSDPDDELGMVRMQNAFP